MDRAYSLIAEETHRTQPSRDLIHMDMLELNEENENLSWSLHFTLNRKDLTWKIVSHDVNFNQSGNSLETSRRVVCRGNCQLGNIPLQLSQQELHMLDTVIKSVIYCWKLRLLCFSHASQWLHPLTFFLSSEFLTDFHNVSCIFLKKRTVFSKALFWVCARQC